MLNALIFLLLKKPSKSYVTFGGYIILCGVFEIISYFSKGNNHNLFQIYTFLEVGLLAVFFLHVFNVWPKMWYLLVIILGFYILFLITGESFFAISMLEKNVFDFVIILASIGSLFYLLNLDLTKSNEQPIKYFIFGLLLNFTGSFTIFLFLDQISAMEQSMINSVWGVKIILNLLAQILFLTGIFYFQRKST